MEGRKSGSRRRVRGYERRGGRTPGRKKRAGAGPGQSAGAYTPAGRKYGKRGPASFSSIRFELLSSRRALSIVAENYFIIARSAGLECSSAGVLRGEKDEEEEMRTSEGGGADWKGGCTRKKGRAAAAVPRFIDPCEGKPQAAAKNRRSDSRQFAENIRRSAATL